MRDTRRAAKKHFVRIGARILRVGTDGIRHSDFFCERPNKSTLPYAKADAQSIAASPWQYGLMLPDVTASLPHVRMRHTSLPQ
jgi:hypothetical protein